MSAIKRMRTMSNQRIGNFSTKGHLFLHIFLAGSEKSYAMALNLTLLVAKMRMSRMYCQLENRPELGCLHGN